MSDQIQVARPAPGVAELKLNRPEKRNALTQAMYGALRDRLRELDSDPDVRAILIRGEGAGFTAGNDLMDFAQGAAAERGDSPVFGFLHALADVETPLVAAVHGQAVGIGVTLLLHCDLVLASEDAVLSTPFVELGLVPEAASSLLMPRIMGHGRAAAMLLLGERLSAAQAQDAGLVWKVTSAATLTDEALAVCRTLASRPPQAMRLSKALMKADRAEIHARMDEEGAHFAERLRSDEVREAISAFFARRTQAAA